jgi:hypothetical protein
MRSGHQAFSGRVAAAAARPHHKGAVTAPRPIATGCILLILGLAGCGSVQPYEYQGTVGEIPPGRGLFTRDKGELILYSSDGRRAEKRGTGATGGAAD